MRALAVLLAATLAAAPGGARAGDPVILSEQAPPRASTRVIWRGAEGGEGAGYWLPDAQVQAAAKRILACEKARDLLVEDLGTARGDAALAEARAGLSWKWWVALVGVGVAGGVLIGKAIQ